MPQENASPDAQHVSLRIAEVLATEFESAALRGDFGVVAQDIPQIDLRHLLDLVTNPQKKKRANNLRVSIVGHNAVVEECKARRPSTSDSVSSTEEDAVSWRNKRLRTIAVVTDKPLKKAASLREFRVIRERDLVRRFCSDQKDKSEVRWLRALWDALERGRSLRIGLLEVVRFALALERLPAAQRSTLAPKHLHHLGMLPDQHLADESSDTRLIRRLINNRDLLSNLRQATSEDWTRIRRYIKSLTSSSDKKRAHSVLSLLKTLGEVPTLQQLEYGEVFKLWTGKPQRDPIDGGERSRGQKAPLENIVGRLLLEDDRSRLRDIAEEVSQVVEHALDEDGVEGRQEIRSANSPDEVSELSIDLQVIQLVKFHSTETYCGGLIHVASDKPAAITDISAHRDWSPFTLQDILDEVTKFVDEGIAPPEIVHALNDVISLRLQLVPYACQLAVAPIATLAGLPDVFACASNYLKTYEKLLRQVHAHYTEMHGAADEEAEKLVGLLLSLEFYIFQRDSDVEVVMSPLHPLYLWRPVTVVAEVRGLVATLAKHELATIEEACSDDLQILQVIVVPMNVLASEQPLLLGLAGRLGRLPIFRESPRGLLETDGVRTLGDMAQRLARLRPFVRPGLQVVLVNPPQPSRFIRELVDGIEAEDEGEYGNSYRGLHVRIRYTHLDTKGWTSELYDLDESLREVINRGQETAAISLAVQAEPITWEELGRELEVAPAHLVLVLDPFEVRSSPVPKAQTHSLSPWIPTCEYRFNRIRKEVQVIPVAEEHVFGSYIGTAALLYTGLQRKTPAHLPQVSRVKEHLDNIAANATWTLIADPHRVPLPRLGRAEVLDRRQERSRQLTCFTDDLSPFVRRLDGQLRRTHFVADSQTLEHLVRDLVALEPNGILGLATSNSDKQVKGSLGKVIATRWYRLREPSGLAVSLDTPNAGRWLVAGHHGGEKADLLGLREEADQVVIDVIEVKTHDDAAPYSVSEGQISGHAVGQVLATLQAVAEIFSTTDTSPLSKPRREVLRDHLYTALSRDHEASYIERWHGLLNDIFEGKTPVRLVGRIVHIQLASVAPKESRIYDTASQIPIRVDTVSAEDVGLVLHSSARMPTTPLPPGPKATRDATEVVDPTAALARLTVRLPNEGSDTTIRGTSVTNGLDASGRADVAAEDPAVSGGRSSTPVDSTSAASPMTLNVPLGFDRAGNQPVVWSPGKQSNGFFLILGASGSGKTETLKVIGTSVSDSGIPVLTFDFHGDVRIRGAESVLLSSGSLSTCGLNPMELDILSAEESGLYDQRSTLKHIIHRAIPSLGHRQSKLLKDAFDLAYSRAGIIDNQPDTWRNIPPSFKTVQDILSEWADDESFKSQRNAIDGCIAAIQDLFDHPIFGRSKLVSVQDLLLRSYRLDLSKLPDSVRFIATETLLRKIFRVLRLQGPIPVAPATDQQRFRLFVIIDEAKILSMGGGDRDDTSSILNELITESRKFGLGMILASQMSDHFSEEVRANAATWLVLRPMDVREARRNAPNVAVEADDLMRLEGHGDGYYRDRSSKRVRRIQVERVSSEGGAL